jgi:hypothetical protein
MGQHVLGSKGSTKQGTKRANGGKASARDSIDGQASTGEEVKTPTTAKHPQWGRALTLSAAKHLLERRQMTATTKYLPENPMTAKYSPREEAIAAKHPLLEQNDDKLAKKAISSAIGQTIVSRTIGSHRHIERLHQEPMSR